MRHGFDTLDKYLLCFLQMVRAVKRSFTWCDISFGLIIRDNSSAQLVEIGDSIMKDHGAHAVKVARCEQRIKESVIDTFKCRCSGKVGSTWVDSRRSIYSLGTYCLS